MASEQPDRATHRWQGYDHASKGVYNLTICTQDRLHLFGRVANGILQPSPIGELVTTHHVLTKMTDQINTITQIHYQILTCKRMTHVRSEPPGIPPDALGQIVSIFRSSVTRMAYRNDLLPQGKPEWQRNYWDRVICNVTEHERIINYIRNNPKNGR